MSPMPAAVGKQRVIAMADECDDLPLFFIDDADAKPNPDWRILIVDDEPAIHDVTMLVLSGLRFRERRLSFLNAYNSADAERLLASHDDIAVILLDVVMETDDAGLRLVHYIRNQLHNDLARIILRTGQAGQAPERQVILEYDINDYKEKTELTAQKLSTAVIAALRGYLALTELAQLNRGLEEKVKQRTEELERSNARLQHSLAALEKGERAGRQVQFKLLPKSRWQFSGMTFSHLLMPSEFMSGDFVDYFKIDSNTCGFYIADVSGHGVASAFVTVYLKRFIATALEAHRNAQPSLVADPARLLDQLNQELLREKVGKHIAIFYGVIGPGPSLLFANAGATPFPILADSSGSRYLECKSTPAGLFERSNYLNQVRVLADHFRLLLCSDGVLELLPDSLGQRSERLRLELQADTVSLDAICASLQINAQDQRPDDIAMLMIERNAP